MAFYDDILHYIEIFSLTLTWWKINNLIFFFWFKYYVSAKKSTLLAHLFSMTLNHIKSNYTFLYKWIRRINHILDEPKIELAGIVLFCFEGIYLFVFMFFCCYCYFLSDFTTHKNSGFFFYQIIVPRIIFAFVLFFFFTYLCILFFL